MGHVPLAQQALAGQQHTPTLLPFDGPDQTPETGPLFIELAPPLSDRLLGLCCHFR
jgi:hypothetical protein